MATTTPEYVITGKHHPPITVAPSNKGGGVFLKQSSSWIRIDLDTFEAVIDAVDSLFDGLSDTPPELGKLHKHVRPEVVRPSQWGK